MIAYPIDKTQSTDPPVLPASQPASSEQSIQERLFNELIEEGHRLRAETWRLREENAEKDELIERLRAGRPDSELLEDAQQLISELRDQLEDLTAKYRYQSEVNDRNTMKQAYTDLEGDRRKRLLSNRHLSGNQKVIFQAIETEIKAQTSDPTEFTPVNLLAIEQRTGLGHNCVSKEVGRLQEYGAWQRDDTFEERMKRGKKIIVDKISLAMTELAVKAPEDIRPGAGEERNHGGKRDRCKKCNSTNVRRLFHLQCLDCGHEFVNYHDPEEDALEVVAIHSDQADDSQHSNQVDQAKKVGQRASSSHLKLLGNDAGQEQPAQLIQVERVAAISTSQEETSERRQDDTRNQTSSENPPNSFKLNELQRPAPATSEPAQLIQVERVAADQPQTAQLDTHIPTKISTKSHKLPACKAMHPINADGKPAKACNEHGHADKIVGYQACGSTAWYPVGGADEYICVKCYSPIAWTEKRKS